MTFFRNLLTKNIYFKLKYFLSFPQTFTALLNFALTWKTNFKRILIYAVFRIEKDLHFIKKKNSHRQIKHYYLHLRLNNNASFILQKN